MKENLYSKLFHLFQLDSYCRDAALESRVSVKYLRFRLK